MFDRVGAIPEVVLLRTMLAKGHRPRDGEGEKSIGRWVFQRRELSSERGFWKC
jgi:hypothetical protein